MTEFQLVSRLIDEALERGKYELLPTRNVTRHGRPLLQIRALKDLWFNVRAGDRGGYVEHPGNLSQTGHCWIAEGAIVLGLARVEDDAFIADNARVFGCARVSQSARIAGDARVGGAAHVTDAVRVHGQAKVAGRAEVFGSACISGTAHVLGAARVRDDAEIYGEAWVMGCASICGSAHIAGRAVLRGGAEYCAGIVTDGDRRFGPVVTYAVLHDRHLGLAARVQALRAIFR